MELLISSFTVIVNLILGLFVYLKNPKNPPNQLLFFLAIQLSLWAIFNYFSLHSSTETSTLFWIRAVMAVTAPIGISILMLVDSFPEGRYTIYKPFRHLLWLLVTLTMVVSMTPLLFHSVAISADGQISPKPGIGIVIYAVLLIGGLIFALVKLIRKLHKSQGIKKTQLQYLLGALVTTFGLAVITNFIFVVLLGQSNFVIFGPLFSLILVSTLGYAIVKHSFMDINLLLFRTVSYAFLIFVIVTMYALALLALSLLVPSEFQYIISVVLAVFLAFTFNPLKSFIEKITKNIFYKESYSSEILLESLGSILRSTLSINTLTNNTLTELCNTMHITQAVYFLKTREDKFIPRSHGYKSTPELSSTAIQNLISAVDNELLIFDQLEESAIKMLMRQNNISIVIPLRVKSTYHGILILGEKASGEIYSSQDIDILEIFAPQISIAIQNALSYDEIKHFADTLKNEVEIATLELKAANRHLKHLDRLKNEFIFIATHELKNPVTAMRGYLSMLNEGLFGKIPEKMQEPLTQLNSSNQQLVELVNDLLQIARSEAKTLTIHSEVVDVCSLVDVICGNLKALADQKKITFNHSCSNPEKLTINADPQRVKEILNNLISNAIKYSEKGIITITHELQDSMVVTHVSDQGVGISASDQKKLFTRFFRVEAEAAKGIPGTGLGLYIIKQIIEKMGGTIWLKSEVGKGSTFSFSLPKAN